MVQVIQDTIYADTAQQVASNYAGHSSFAMRLLEGGHLLPVMYGSPGFTAGSATNPLWYFIFLFLVLTGVAMSQVFFGDLAGRTFISSTRFNWTVSKFNDNSLFQRQIDNVLYLNYFLVFGFFLFWTETWSGYRPYRLEGWELFLFNLAFLVIWFYARVIVLNLAGHLFNRLSLFREFIYHSFTYNKLLGLVMIPVTFLVVYTTSGVKEIMILLAFALVIGIVVMKIARGVIFSLKRNVFNFYLFLYLCALEMVPILLVYKWITSTL